MTLPWWKERVFYQIYPRSFQDSNGDGIGDLRGILSRLDYLKWLGVGAIWLCPVYDSPNEDMGYDIRNYEDILAEFGTLADFDALLDGLHSRDMKLVMDLVVNHSSDEHPWFVESRKSRDNPYRDYYLWRDGKQGHEPNNWSSFFTPSAWTYDVPTDQWYLHLFSEKQPDLNWENPALRQDVYAMMNRWFDRGVDGFRMDVISLIAKDPALPDGRGSGYVFAPEHFAFQPKLHEYLREMRQACFAGRDCMCVGETTFVTAENANSVVGDGDELDLLFQFDLMDVDSGSCKWDLRPFHPLKFKQILSKWQKAIDWNTLFLCNHDQPRPVSRFGSTETEALRKRSAKMLATALYLLRGTPFIYQGEELGMTNFPFTDKKQFRDIETLAFLAQAEKRGEIDAAWHGILAKGRDNARTPMQWDASANAGFTTGTPWIAVNPNYQAVNAAQAIADPDSILHYYRALIALRASHPALLFGPYRELLPEHPQILAYTRQLEDEQITVLCNLTPQLVRLDGRTIPLGRMLLRNTDANSETELLPYEAAVLEDAC